MARASRAKKHSQGCDIDMTPMIDVVFQLIIFFIVTITLTKKFNEKIVLAEGPNGVLIDAKQPPQTLTIELDSKGRLSLHGIPMKYTQMRSIVKRRYNAMGTYPVLIRADKDVKHEYVRTVMNICTEAGLAKVGFVAIQKHAGA